MTVTELIAALRDMPGDLPVTLSVGSHDGAVIVRDIHRGELSDADHVASPEGRDECELFAYLEYVQPSSMSPEERREPTVAR